ncbi:hypothetical protein BC938DRAFT_473997 [Jimgerdemannia flammicorona]|uniref:Protein root UVB sensitive/RUS domain-containing protein n=2 Tax=Jimgerdemannia flammicorona TaxID=994334 RepID=A0A433Q324_9FUNG|nr:hypothetical protein BC938DRAFT_473997 [Jimgerdemannia flammicorona]
MSNTIARETSSRRITTTFSIIEETALGDVIEKNVTATETGLLQFLREAFLPTGYPESVTEDYLAYQIYDTAQAFCSSITGLLSTRAVLKGVGVGDAMATATSALIVRVIHETTGRVGTILFAWKVGLSTKGTALSIVRGKIAQTRWNVGRQLEYCDNYSWNIISPTATHVQLSGRLDSDCKTWRLAAGMICDIIAPTLPKPFFLPITCVGTLLRAFTGVAGGATRAALTQHFARMDNMAGGVNLESPVRNIYLRSRHTSLNFRYLCSRCVGQGLKPRDDFSNLCYVIWFAMLNVVVCWPHTIN